MFLVGSRRCKIRRCSSCCALQWDLKILVVDVPISIVRLSGGIFCKGEVYGSDSVFCGELWGEWTLKYGVVRRPYRTPGLLLGHLPSADSAGLTYASPPARVFGGSGPQVRLGLKSVAERRYLRPVSAFSSELRIANFEGGICRVKGRRTFSFSRGICGHSLHRWECMRNRTDTCRRFLRNVLIEADELIEKSVISGQKGGKQRSGVRDQGSDRQ